MSRFAGLSRRQLVLGAGVLGAGALLLSAEPEPASDLATAVVRGPVGPVGPAGPAKAAPQTEASALPTLRDRREMVEQARANHRAQALFAPHDWAPPPPPAPPSSQPAAPQAPPLPFRYLGQQWQGGQLEVFLARGDKLHVVAAGGQIEGQYRVDAIHANRIDFTYLPLNQTQQLSYRASE